MKKRDHTALCALIIFIVQCCVPQSAAFAHVSTSSATIAAYHTPDINPRLADQSLAGQDAFQLKITALRQSYDSRIKANQEALLRDQKFDLKSTRAKFDPSTNKPYAFDANPFNYAAIYYAVDKDKDSDFIAKVRDVQQRFAHLFKEEDIYLMASDRIHMHLLDLYGAEQAVPIKSKNDALFEDSAWSKPGIIAKVIETISAACQEYSASDITYERLILNGDGTMTLLGLPTNDTIFKIKEEVPRAIEAATGTKCLKAKEWVHTTIGKISTGSDSLTLDEERAQLLAGFIDEINRELSRDPIVWHNVNKICFSDKNNFIYAYPEGERVVARQRITAAQLKYEIIDRAGKRDGHQFAYLLNNLKDALQAEQKEGLLKPRIDQITSKKYFSEKGITYIPDTEGDLYVVGDLHGDMAALEAFYKETDMIGKLYRGEKCHVVFLGDYVDVGKNIIPVIESVAALKIAFPRNVTLLAGNHEFIEENVADTRYWVDETKTLPQSLWDIICTGETITTRFGDEALRQFEEIVDSFPVLAVTRNNMVFAHGGHLPNHLLNKLNAFDSQGLMALVENKRALHEVSDAFIYRENNEKDGKDILYDQDGGSIEVIAGKESFDRFMQAIGGSVMLRGHDRQAPWDHLYFDDRMLSIITTGYDSPDHGYFKNEKIISRYAKFDLMAQYRTIEPKNVIHGLDPSRVATNISFFDPQAFDVHVVISGTGEQGGLKLDQLKGVYTLDNISWQKFQGNQMPRKSPLKELEQTIATHDNYNSAWTVSNGNLFHNDWNITYANKKLFTRLDEPIGLRTYTCFVVMNDYTIKAKRLRFVQEAGAWRVYEVDENDRVIGGLTDQIQYAVFGQQIVKSGNDVDLTDIANEFDDLFHLFAFPQDFSLIDVEEADDKGDVHVVKRAKYNSKAFGRDEFYVTRTDNGAPRDVERTLVRKALSGKVVDIQVAAKDLSTLRQGLKARGYRSAWPLKVVKNEGEYLLKKNKDKSLNGEIVYTLSVILKRMYMEHTAIGITRSGKAVTGVFAGNKDLGIGLTPEIIRAKMRARCALEGEELDALFMLSNGGDAFIRKDGAYVTKTDRAYGAAASLVAFCEKKTKPGRYISRETFDEMLSYIRMNNYVLDQDKFLRDIEGRDINTLMTFGANSIRLIMHTTELFGSLKKIGTKLPKNIVVAGGIGHETRFLIDEVRAIQSDRTHPWYPYVKTIDINNTMMTFNSLSKALGRPITKEIYDGQEWTQLKETISSKVTEADIFIEVLLNIFKAKHPDKKLFIVGHTTDLSTEGMNEGSLLKAKNYADTVIVVYENRSTNTGDNVQFSKALIEKAGIVVDKEFLQSTIATATPPLMRRTQATLAKQLIGELNDPDYWPLASTYRDENEPIRILQLYMLEMAKMRGYIPQFMLEPEGYKEMYAKIFGKLTTEQVSDIVNNKLAGYCKSLPDAAHDQRIDMYIERLNNFLSESNEINKKPESVYTLALIAA